MMPDKLLWWWHRYRLRRAQKNITPHCFQEIHAAKGTKEKREMNCSENQIWEVQTNKKSRTTNGKQKSIGSKAAMARVRIQTVKVLFFA